MAPDDLEPIDLEPIDLEPGDDDPRDHDPRDHDFRGERSPGATRGGPSPRVALALLGAGVMAIAAIALTTHAGRSRPTSTPIPSPGRTSPAPTTSPADPIAALQTGLSLGLEAVGSGRFAMVVDHRLYLVDAEPAHLAWTPVPLPAGEVTIEDQSGPALLAATLQQTIVSTQPLARRTLSAHDTTIPAVAPNRWWFLRDDGTIRDDRGDARRAPTGVSIVAAVQDGFVGLAQPDFRWVLWTPDTVRDLAPPGYQLLVAGGASVVFKSNCGYNGCELELVDVTHGTVFVNRLGSVPEFAAFSPDGTRLALASTQGNVLVLDPSTGAVIAQVQAVSAQNASLPFTWTPDSRALLVVGDNDLSIVHTSDGLVTGDIKGTQGLQQLVTLP